MLKNIFILFLFFLLPLASVQSAIQPIEPQNPSEIPTEISPEQGEPPHLQTTTKTYESAFIKMIIFLFGILIFVFIIFFLFKKFSSQRMIQSNHFRTIKILEKRAISPKSMLYLVEIGGKKILLAESQLEIRNVSNLEWIESDKKGF